MRWPGRRLRYLLLACSVLLLGINWLFNSNAGLSWVLQRAEAYLPGTLQLEQVDGTLGGPLRIAHLSYRLNGLSIDSQGVLIDWSPLALLLGQLRFSAVEASRITLQLPASQAGPTTLPNINLPLGVSIARLTLGEIVITRRGMQEITVTELSAGARLGQGGLKLNEFRCSAFDTTLALTGSIELRAGYAHDLALEWTVMNSPYGRLVGKGHLRGDLAHTRLRQTLTAPAEATADFQLFDLLSQPRTQGVLNVSPVMLQEISSALPPVKVGLRAKLSGDLHGQQASAEFTTDAAELGPLQGNLKLSHAAGLIRLERLELRSPDNSRSAQAHGQWQMADGGGLAELDLSWRGLSWPMQGEPQLTSTVGSANARGNLHRFLLDLSTQIRSPHWVDASLNATGKGSLDGLDLTSVRLTTLQGEIHGPVTLGWADGLHWKARLSGKGLDPGVRWPQWPGQLGFKLVSHGDTRGGLNATLQLLRLSGQLRHYPVSLSGTLGLRNGVLALDNAVLTSAGSRLTASGKLGDTLQLDWGVHSGDLAELYPELHGVLQASGTVAGRRTAPQVTLQLAGQGLTWQEQHIGNIEARGNADLFKWRAINLDLKGREIALFDQSLAQLDITLSTRAEQQRLNLTATHHYGALTLKANGTLHQQHWQGQLEGIGLDSVQFGKWRQPRATAINFDAGDLRMTPLCLVNDRQRACLSVTGNKANWAATLDGEQIALGAMSAWLPKTLTLNGVAELKLQANYRDGNKLSGRGEVQLPPGQLNYRPLNEQGESWPYQQGKLAFVLDDTGLSANVSVQGSTQVKLVANAKLPNLDPFTFDPATQPLDARLEFVIDDLAPLESFIFEVQQVKGRAGLHADLGGTLLAPRLSGTLQLSDGALRVPRLGLSISNIAITASGNQQQAIDYRLTAHSGAGELTLTGNTQLRADKGWPTQIRIVGKEVRVANIPEARIDVSPDLTIKVRHHRIDTDGEIHIPYARLQPVDVGNANTASGDVHIQGVNQDIEQLWQLYSSVRLDLGQRVSLYGFGFEGRIVGNVLLSDKPGSPTFGVGELKVAEGHYRAYGQRLEIERGRLLFASSPINNPGLDLRAVRHIQDVTAGISVGGTLRSPQFEVFSVPAMDQTNALAYLVLGRPLDQASGAESSVIGNAALALGLKGGDFLAHKIGDRIELDEVRIDSSATGDNASLVIGRYLSPRLYVNYGVGLIESANTVNLRYEISRHWQLNAESGNEQGADLLYTIER